MLRVILECKTVRIFEYSRTRDQSETKGPRSKPILRKKKKKKKITVLQSSVICSALQGKTASFDARLWPGTPQRKYVRNNK